MGHHDITANFRPWCLVIHTPEEEAAGNVVPAGAPLLWEGLVPAVTLPPGLLVAPLPPGLLAAVAGLLPAVAPPAAVLLAGDTMPAGGLSLLLSRVRVAQMKEYYVCLTQLQAAWLLM